MFATLTRTERLEKDLASARLDVEKTAAALDDARGALTRAVAEGESKATKTAREREAAARAACVAAAERVDEITAALAHVHDDAAKARADEIAGLVDRATKNGERAEAALTEGVALAARGLVLLGEALARAEIAGRCVRSLRERGAKDIPTAPRLHTVTVEDAVAAALDHLYPTRDARRQDESLTFNVNVSACYREE